MCIHYQLQIPNKRELFIFRIPKSISTVFGFSFGRKRHIFMASVSRENGIGSTVFLLILASQVVLACACFVGLLFKPVEKRQQKSY